MIKFLVISFLIFFIIYKLLGFFFKLFLRSSINYQQQQHRSATQRNYSRKPSDGNVNIDFIPKQEKKIVKKKAFNGGEYIDYEEVK